MVEQGDFRAEGIEFRGSKRYYPQYLEWSDTCYYVTLYYPRWKEEGFKFPYTAHVQIRDKSREVYSLHLGGNASCMLAWNVVWGDLHVMWRHDSMNGRQSDRLEAYAREVMRRRTPEAPVDKEVKEGLLSLPVKERNDTLVAIAMRAVKKEMPKWSWEGVVPLIAQGDFAALRLKWVPQNFWYGALGDGLPAYVKPEDTYFLVAFCDPAHGKKGQLSPYVAEVYIVGRTGEAYGVDIEAGYKYWYEKEFGK